MFQEYFALPSSFGVFLTSLAVLVALASKGEGVMWINTILIPLKLIICLSVSFAVLGASDKSVDMGNFFAIPDRPWFFSAILYVSFNLTFALVVLSSLGKEMRGNTTGGVLGGIGLGIFALAIGSSLLFYYPLAGNYQVPMVYIAFQVGPAMGIFYLLILWFAMITAAVGNAFSFTKRIIRFYSVSYWAACLGTLAIAIPLAHFRFSSLVAAIYPAFGYIGLLTLGSLFYAVFQKK